MQQVTPKDKDFILGYWFESVAANVRTTLVILVFWALKGGVLPAANAKSSTSILWMIGARNADQRRTDWIPRSYAAIFWEVDSSDGRSMKPTGSWRLRGESEGLALSDQPFRSTEKRREDEPQRGKGQRSRGGSNTWWTFLEWAPYDASFGRYQLTPALLVHCWLTDSNPESSESLGSRCFNLNPLYGSFKTRNQRKHRAASLTYWVYQVICWLCSLFFIINICFNFVLKS